MFFLAKVKMMLLIQEMKSCVPMETMTVPKQMARISASTCSGEEMIIKPPPNKAQR